MESPTDGRLKARGTKAPGDAHTKGALCPFGRTSTPGGRDGPSDCKRCRSEEVFGARCSTFWQ